MTCGSEVLQRRVLDETLRIARRTLLSSMAALTGSPACLPLSSSCFFLASIIRLWMARVNSFRLCRLRESAVSRRAQPPRRSPNTGCALTLNAMRASFIPADLHLKKTEAGAYEVTFGGAVVVNTRSKGAAVRTFNRLRKEMENRFPPHELSQEEKADAFQKARADEIVGVPGLNRKKKKSTAKSTRTFG